MKDFISKLTFGFIMAQLVPGALVIYSISVLYLAAYNGISLCAHDVLSPISMWITSATNIMAFIVLSTAAGLAVHGLHWAVLGFLEAYYASVADSFWHSKPICLQMILGPIKIVVEIIMLLFKADGIRGARVEENVSFINKDKIDAFNFLQEFYLHFAQFYAHVSYALAFTFCLLVLAVAVSSVLEFNVISIAILIMTWLASGCFFVISRIQLNSLFSAENDLRSN